MTTERKLPEGVTPQMLEELDGRWPSTLGREPELLDFQLLKKDLDMHKDPELMRSIGQGIAQQLGEDLKTINQDIVLSTLPIFP